MGKFLGQRRLPDQPGETRRFATRRPSQDDVLVRQRRGNPRTVYLLGTPSAPDQLIGPTRDEAVAQALAFAKRQRVRAWCDQGNGSFILLGTFRSLGGGAKG